MQLPRPYLYTSPRMVGLVDRPQMMPHEGPLMDPTYGYHTLWIAEVPFIPAPTSEGNKDFDTAASNRITYALQRQIRFLYDLAKSREYLSTFELRLVSWPQPEGFSRVGIAFLGKTFHEEEAVSRHLALELWNKFSAIFPREAPFAYPLVPVTEQNNTGQTHSFAEWYQPVPFEHMLHAGNLVELRKYEDWPTIRDVGGVLHARDYIPHPFKAALDYSSMARLFETLARLQRVSMVAITLRPQRITDQEVVILHELAGWYQRVARGEAVLDNPLVEVLKEFNSNVFEAYLGARAELGQAVYEGLVREHRSLFSIRLQVIGAPVVENDLIEALGSEVMANAGNAYPSRWTPVEPADEQELRRATFNLQWLEFARWGVSPIIRRVPSIIRLRQLTTVTEAAGAFRLPVAPASGGIAGIAVRDEPFVTLETPIQGDSETRFILGMQLDRGVPTELPLTLDIDNLAAFTYLFGSASKSRECVLREILKAATKYGVPWLLIRQQRVRESDVAQGLPIHHAEVNPLETMTELPIEPFLPPPGVPCNAFLDALLRVLTMAYKLDINTSVTLRRVFTEVYEKAGWTQQGDATFDLSTLATALDKTLQHSDLQAVHSIRTKCILPLQDLAMTLGKRDVPPVARRLQALVPLVIDIGWIGSDSSSTLIQGCLWAWFALAFSAQATPTSSGPRGIIAVEDAHSLFGNSPAISPIPTGTLAQMLVRKGVGTLFIDDRSDALNEEILSNPGTIILTQNTNNAAVERAITLAGITERGKTRTRRLAQKEALVVQPGIAPILITLA
jgi:hypothetical protein